MPNSMSDARFTVYSAKGFRSRRWVFLKVEHPVNIKNNGSIRMNFFITISFLTECA